MKLLRHDYINNHALLQLVLDYPRLPKIAQDCPTCPDLDKRLGNYTIDRYNVQQCN